MRATYRVQLTPAFGFAALCEVVPYLHRLGISHLYLSPIWQSRPGSEHGYDITDHGQVNSELGGEPGLQALLQTCRAHSLALVLDIVPNHMAVMNAGNAWWLDVLEHGPASRFAEYFDIDWNPARASMRNRLLVPALGEPLGEVIARRGIGLAFDAARGAFHLQHESLRFPLDPATYPRIFEQIARHTPGVPALDESALAPLTSVLRAFAALPPAVPCTQEIRLLRGADAQAHQQTLALLCAAQPTLAGYINASLRQLQQLPQPVYAAWLAGLLDAQPYRLAFWRVSGEEINYRRFFDINDLAALRMENPEVFTATHALLRRLWQGGGIDGVRVDHADGLYRPAQYFQRLRELLEPGPGSQPWIVAEKILGAGESLPADWVVEGTTGYEFAAQVCGWLMHDTGAASLEKLYRRVVGPGPDYSEVAYQSRRHVMRNSLAAEISGLAARLDRLAQRHLDTSDFTLFDLREAIVEVMAAFPVYRTYIGDGPLSTEDARHIRRAVGTAMSRKQTARRALQFLERVLLGELPDEDSAYRAAALEFTLRFQQVTAPVMAKGIEDTACYRHPCLLAMNEVGGDPQCRGISTETLHQANQARRRRHPRTLLATSTHDTKRGEDARYRLCALTQVAADWANCLRLWRRLKGRRHGTVSVGAAQEYLLLQSLLAIWPLPEAGEELASLRARMEEYAIKAAREAKEQTSWLDPDAGHEEELRDYVKLLLPERAGAGFVRYFRPVIDQSSFLGMLDALSACVLKFTAPGIPDLYQGNELPALVLVDPDNRRQPDFAVHARLLDEVAASTASRPLAEAASTMLDTWWDGRLKLFVSWRLLQLRREQPELFDAAGYMPLDIDGSHAAHLCAYAREDTHGTLLVVVSRWAGVLSGGQLRAPLGEAAWQDTQLRLPAGIGGGDYVDALTGRILRVAPPGAERSLPIAALLATLPVSVLLASAQPQSTNNSNDRPVTP